MIKRKADGGFTLVELMIVVAIVAILAVVASVGYMRHLRKGRLVGGRAFIGEIMSQQAAYYQQHGQYCNASERTDNSTSFYPALSDEPNAKPWHPVAGTHDGWLQLGVYPEGGRTYASVFVRASIPSSDPTTTHGTTNNAISLGVPVQPNDPQALRHPWYFVVAHLDLDGSGCTPGTFPMMSGCTVIWASSGRSGIITLNPGD